MYNRKFGESLDNNSKRPIKCLPLNNHPCQTTTELVDRNSDETLIHLLLVLANVVKVVTFLMIHMLEFLFQIMNEKVFNLMSVVNETRFLVQHDSWECECGLNESVRNSKRKRSHK